MFKAGQRVEAQRYSNGYTDWHRGVITAVDQEDELYARSGPLCHVLFHDYQTPVPRSLDEIRQVSS